MRPVDAGPLLGMLGLLFVIAAITTIILILALRPFLVRYASARPNARSSHSSPTPQGGAIVVAVAATTALAQDFVNDPGRLSILLASATGLAIVGAVDDIRPLDALPRIVLQLATT